MLNSYFYIKWFIYFVFTLLIASIFLGLSKWQFDRAIFNDINNEEIEEVKSIDSIINQNTKDILEAQSYQKVFLYGFFEDKKVIIPNRLYNNKDGVWLVQAFHINNTNNIIPVVRGWFENSFQAFNYPTSDKIIKLKGKLMPTEPDERSNLQLPELKNLSTAQLANIWNTGNMYSCFIVEDSLDIGSPKVIRSINWLNLFYCLEWVFFAGFALFLWFKLMKKDDSKF